MKTTIPETLGGRPSIQLGIAGDTPAKYNVEPDEVLSLAVSDLDKLPPEERSVGKLMYDIVSPIFFRRDAAERPEISI